MLKVISQLNRYLIKFKVKLLKYLYYNIASYGQGDDTELAHINKQEAALLKALGGAGTINPVTGLPQYIMSGGGSSAPSSTSTTQEIPEEIKPYITDIMAKAQAIQEKREAEGYRPYQGQSLAEFTPEQERAMQGISELVGTSQQYLDPAARLTAASARTPTGEEVSQYMSPYMQQVVDIQQREARRQADVSGQQLAAQAVGSGGFGGSRQAILEAEAGRNLQTQLGDIQARGLAGAYEDAQRRLAEQRQRELAGGAQFAQMAPTAVSTGLQELGALQQAGGVRQAQSQAALDIARQQFEAEKAFPEQTLQQYSSIIRGYAMEPNKSSTTFTAAPNYLQQLAGLGSIGTGAYAASKLFKEGGQVGDGKGLASIIVKREHGGKVVKLQEGGLPIDYSSLSTPELFDLLRLGNITGQELQGILRSMGLDPLAEAKKNNAMLNPALAAAAPAAAAPAAAPTGKLPFDIDKVLATTTDAPAAAAPTAAAPAPAPVTTTRNPIDLRSIFAEQLKSGEDYKSAYTEGLQKMREGAKTDKEIAGLNFIQQSLAALANTAPGAKLGEMVAQASPTISQATTAALKANKEAQAELRTAEMGEKKMGYEMSKEKLSSYAALQKALKGSSLSTADQVRLSNALIEKGTVDATALEGLINSALSVGNVDLANFLTQFKKTISKTQSGGDRSDDRLIEINR